MLLGWLDGRFVMERLKNKEKSKKNMQSVQNENESSPVSELLATYILIQFLSTCFRSFELDVQYQSILV